jgi:lipopolysaccharide transport system ATP-binding protein
MPAIEVTGISKLFRLPHEKSDSLLERVAGIVQILDRERYTYEDFWALRDVSFKVDRGQSLGVIGENGSGKSTLLKIIAGVIQPTKGTFACNGKLAPILELGVGFDPRLSVIDNVLLYGSIMGLRNREIRAQLKTILEFAGVENFKDAKLKNLSSGMQARLAFAVATQTDPDILIVDEALSVGDIDFQRKSLQVFKEYQEEGKTMILVSHSLQQIRDFCPVSILLSHGSLVSYGETAKVIQAYTDPQAR